MNYINEARAAGHKVIGTCQACGRSQAVLKSGLMSKHGYTVERGWFEGTCPGQFHQPLELERSYTDEVVALIRADVAKMEQDLESYRNGTGHPAEVSVYSTRATKMVAWEDAREFERINGLKQAIYSTEAHIERGAEVANTLAELADEVHGTKLTVKERRT